MLLGLLLALASLCAAAGLGYLASRYLREREELSRVRELFSRYVPGHVVEEILARPNASPLWAQRHYATVLCCRIRTFGLFAEELSAEETLRHLNEFYAVAGRAIVRHHGVIERLHADGVTAIFGVLTSDVFQEERALRAALRIVRLANAMNDRWQAEGRRRFQVSIGVNSGNVVAGEVGFAQRREFAIVGNPANVAARLQQAAEEINASILASSATYEPVAELFVGVPVTELPLAGLKKLQRAYIVRGLVKRTDEELLRLPAEIVSLQTMIEPETTSEELPLPRLPEPPAPMVSSPPHFSGFDDLYPAMPETPPVAGEYEEPPTTRFQ
jgi:class 3 adenylate cyclase